MSVERRYSARHPLDLKVHIRYRKRRFYSARGLNLSVDGMFLAVQSLTLPTGTLVELEFEACGREWLIAAVVVHHTGGGVGVMFRDPQPVLFRDLTQAESPLYPPQPGQERSPLHRL